MMVWTDTMRFRTIDTMLRLQRERGVPVTIRRLARVLGCRSHAYIGQLLPQLLAEGYLIRCETNASYHSYWAAKPYFSYRLYSRPRGKIGGRR